MGTPIRAAGHLDDGRCGHNSGPIASNFRSDIARDQFVCATVQQTRAAWSLSHRRSVKAFTGDRSYRCCSIRTGPGILTYVNRLYVTRMDQKDRGAAIRNRIDEQIEVIAQAICDNKEPVAAQRVLAALAGRLAAEEALETGNAVPARLARAKKVGFGAQSSSSGLCPSPPARVHRIRQVLT